MEEGGHSNIIHQGIANATSKCELKQAETTRQIQHGNTECVKAHMMYLFVEQRNDKAVVNLYEVVLLPLHLMTNGDCRRAETSTPDQRV